jgi:site-specific DNA-methyltransferase (adenine-specific)
MTSILGTPELVSEPKPLHTPEESQLGVLHVPSELGELSFKTELGSLVVGDCLSALRNMPSNTVDLVITSPPYDGQQKYGNGEKYERDWYKGFFLDVTAEIYRILKPSGSFVLNYRSKRQGSERGTLQYEIVFWLREQGFLFCEDFIWGKPSPPPGRFNKFLKDAVEYCFQFSKTQDWQFFPEQCLSPARWDAKDRERRKKLAHNYVRANAPSGQGRKRVQAGPDLVRPSTLLHLEPEFSPNPVKHPARFPVMIPTFFINLLTRPGQIVVDPFGGTGTTALAAELLGRRWFLTEIDPSYAAVLPSRLKAGR